MKEQTKVDRIVAAIREAGLLTSRDIWERFQVAQKNQQTLLRSVLGNGTIRAEKIESGGHKRRQINAYRWIGAAAAEHPATGPRRPGKRTCLCCGKSFASRDAGNRLCPYCKGAAARAGGGTAFDTPVHLRYR